MPEQRYIIYDCELEVLFTIATCYFKCENFEVKRVVDNIRKRKIDQSTEEG